MYEIGRQADQTTRQLLTYPFHSIMLFEGNKRVIRFLTFRIRDVTLDLLWQIAKGADETERQIIRLPSLFLSYFPKATTK